MATRTHTTGRARAPASLQAGGTATGARPSKASRSQPLSADGDALATPESIAHLDFEPWPEEAARQFMTGTEFVETARADWPYVQFAVLTMTKPKAELIAMFKADERVVGDLLETLIDLTIRHKALLGMLESAQTRLLCAGAAYALGGTA